MSVFNKMSNLHDGAEYSNDFFLFGSQLLNITGN